MNVTQKINFDEHKCDKKPENAIIYYYEGFWYIDAGYEDELEDVIYCPWCGERL